MKGPAPQDTPDLVTRLRALAGDGASDLEIADRLGLGESTVKRYRHRHGIRPGRDAVVEREVAPEPGPARRAPIAELVSAARPRAQRPWSARDGLR